MGHGIGIPVSIAATFSQTWAFQTFACGTGSVLLLALFANMLPSYTCRFLLPGRCVCFTGVDFLYCCQRSRTIPAWPFVYDGGW